MRRDSSQGIESSHGLPSTDPQTVRDRWEPPSVEVICLACEISAYAPDGDLPLF